MAERAPESLGRFLNPCLLHLQKMELELKCPLCLKLLNKPMLLPCNHLYCSSCLKNVMTFGLRCAVCESSFLCQDLRAAPHIATMVTICKCLNAAFGTNYRQLAPVADVSDAKRSSSESPDSCNTSTEDKSQGEATQVVSKKKTIVAPSSNSKDVLIDQGRHYSPPSIGVTKDSDADSSDPKSAQKRKKSCKRDQGCVVTHNSGAIPPACGDHLVTGSDFGRGSEKVTQVLSPAEDDPLRESKRQNLDIELGNNVGKNTIVDSEKGTNADLVSSPQCNSARQNSHGSPVSKQLNCAKPSMTCVFCHSSTESKASGPMLHYSNGEPITSNQTFPSDVQHVHQKCIEWAPQVYFSGDTANNLEGEVSRAAKIKCSQCGKKGAALGCYAKSCRKSFHPSCAAEVSGCRWDHEDFLLFCPTHSAKRFPSERSKSRKKAKSSQPSDVEIENFPPSTDPPTVKQETHGIWTDASGVARGWVLCGSALSGKESDLLVKFAKMTGGSLSKDCKSNVTHVIASTDEFGACSRTLKFLIGVLTGKWIIKIDWIKACIEAAQPVPEDFYEISHDIHGFFDGPKSGRMRLLQKEPSLFSGSRFYLSGEYVPSYRGYLEELIALGGGTMMEKTELLGYGLREVNTTSFVVYSKDPPAEGTPRESVEVIQERLEEARALASDSCSLVVSHTWLLDSIAACKLQPLPN